IGVETGSNVLDVEHERVDVGQHFWPWAAAVSLIKAINRGTGDRLLGVFDSLCVLFAGYAVLGREYRADFDACGGQEVDIASSVAGQTGVVGDQTDSFPAQAGEVLGREHVQSCLHLRVARDGAVESRAD